MPEHYVKIIRKITEVTYAKIEGDFPDGETAASEAYDLASNVELEETEVENYGCEYDDLEVIPSTREDYETALNESKPKQSETTAPRIQSPAQLAAEISDCIVETARHYSVSTASIALIVITRIAQDFLSIADKSRIESKDNTPGIY